jgi:hypothetical protein
LLRVSFPAPPVATQTPQDRMAPVLGSIDHISQVISQVVAPSFMLAAVTAFISMLFGRMDVTLARIRDLNAIAQTDLVRLPLKQSIPRMKWRIKVMHRSILLAICSGITTTILIITAFSVAILGFQHVWGTAALFIVALGFFCASLCNLALAVFSVVGDLDER